MARPWSGSRGCNQSSTLYPATLSSGMVSLITNSIQFQMPCVLRRPVSARETGRKLPISTRNSCAVSANPPRRSQKIFEEGLWDMKLNTFVFQGHDQCLRDIGGCICEHDAGIAVCWQSGGFRIDLSCKCRSGGKCKSEGKDFDKAVHAGCLPFRIRHPPTIRSVMEESSVNPSGFFGLTTRQHHAGIRASTIPAYQLAPNGIAVSSKL